MEDNNFIYKTHEEFVINSVIANRPLVDYIREIQGIYCADDRPWVIGFSGGKDSTAILSLAYFAVFSLPPEKRTKNIYVVSSDTLVETPVVVDMIKNSIESISIAAANFSLPISAHIVTPKKNETYWANLLGKGYPAPTRTFRWCTERLKINPVSEFILDKVTKFGEVIVVLGSRRQESASRAQVITKHKIDGSALSRHTSLPNAYTYMPIENWSAEDVWEYLLSAPRAWGGSNQLLFDLYKDSNAGECPLVIDTSTPSCGNSRFGCWTCTVVTKDKAIEGLIETGEEWMKPLLDFRNMLHETTLPENKSKYRNYKRRTGKVTFARSNEIQDDSQNVAKHIPGPYWLKYRQEWLKKLLEIEKEIRKSGNEIDLIDREELQIIRREWLQDPNEPDWEDTLPKIYSSIYPEEKINWVKDDSARFNQDEQQVLKQLEAIYGVPAPLVMKLIDTEISFSGLAKRKGIIDSLESILSQDWESLEEIKDRQMNTINVNEFALEAEKYRSVVEALTK